MSTGNSLEVGAMVNDVAEGIDAKLLKLDRLVAWTLFLVILAYISTGFSMVGKYGFNKLIPIITATQIHNNLCIPMIILFLLHVGVHFYFSLKRWKVIKTNNE